MQISDTAIYLTDNGAAYCGAHLGATARATGRDISGQPIMEVTQEMLDRWDAGAFRCEHPKCQSRITKNTTEPTTLTTKTPTAKQAAASLAARTADAYSHDRYKNWNAVAKKLLAHGFTEREAEAIMRSKWMRWAADRHPARYGKVPASAIIDYIGTIPEKDEPRPRNWWREPSSNASQRKSSRRRGRGVRRLPDREGREEVPHLRGR